MEMTIRGGVGWAFLVGLLIGGCGSPGESGGGGNPGSPKFPAPAPLPFPHSPECQPLAEGPAWVLEDETASWTFGCAAASSDEANAGFALAGVPEGAAWDPATSTLSWTPALDQAAVWPIEVTVVETGEMGRVEIAVADAWEHPDNVPVVDPLRYPSEFGLPVIFLSPAPGGFSDYAPTTVVHGGHTYVAEGKRRGATSRAYPKKNYTLKFAKTDKFQEPSRGFMDKRKIVLLGEFDDNSHLRARLSFGLWNRMDPGHIQVDAYPAVLYVDGKYHGLYTVVDHVDGFLMEDHGHDQDGDLYKTTSHDANFRLTLDSGGTKPTPHVGHEKKEGFPEEGEPGAWLPLDDFIRFTATASTQTFRTEFPERADLRDYRDWWIFVTLVYGNDSAGKNAFHYRSTGTPWRYVPWDFNASFGQNWRTERTSPSTNETFAGRNRIFERFLADQEFRDPMYARYAEVLVADCPASEVQAWIDAWALELEPSALRDEARWGGAYRDWTGWGGRHDLTEWTEEVDYLRRWVDRRWSHQTDRFATSP